MGVVVVGVDRSETSTNALKEALSEASWRDASVVVAYVMQMPAYASAEIGIAAINLTEVREAGVVVLDEYLAEVEASIEGGFPVPVDAEVLMGHAGFQILDCARRHEADLVVLGSRGLGGVKGLLLGSVTTYAVHHIRRPLLVVPDVEDDEEQA